MRRWAAVASTALRTVADQPRLWLPGSLAWVSTIGWVPFIVAVFRPPSVGELTVLGPRFFTSGMWPLNLILVGVGMLAVVVLALLAASAGNAMLIAAAEHRPASTADVPRLLVPALVAAVPVMVGVLAIAVALIGIAPGEFNRPQVEPGPVVRTTLRLAPLIVFTGVVAIVASTLAGLAGRAAIRSRAVAAGLAAVPSLVRGAGRGGLVHLAVAVAIGAAYLVFATLLLSVLWAPFAAFQDAGAPFDVAGALLLVGFVTIWLCLVLGGGAVHAWGSMTATLLLGGRTKRMAPDRPQEMQIDR